MNHTGHPTSAGRVAVAIVVGLVALAVAAVAGAFGGAAAFAYTSEELDHAGGFLANALVVGTIAVGAGAGAVALAGVRSSLVQLVSPVVAIATFTVGGAIAIAGMAPDRDDDTRRNSPLLAELSPPPGGRSSPPETASTSAEFPAVYETRRVDRLTTETIAREAADYYASEMRSQGWRVRVIEHVSESVPYRLDGWRGTATLDATVFRSPGSVSVELRADHDGAGWCAAKPEDCW